MRRTVRSFWLLFFCCFLLLCEGCLNSQASRSKKKQDTEVYKCLPCGQDCDSILHDKAGECTSCHMQLVKRSSIIFKSIEASIICEYIKEHPTAILLDVRTKEEFEGKADPNFGTLKNAINIPVQDLEKQLPGISQLKNKEILVYCSHSHRSPMASYLLTQNGFTNVTNMAGGMSVVTDVECKK